MVLRAGLCFSLRAWMYSKLGVSLPFSVMMARLRHGKSFCSSKGAFALLLTISGIQSLSSLLNYMASIREILTSIIGEFTGKEINCQINKLAIVIMIIESLLAFKRVKVEKGSLGLGILLQALNRAIQVTTDLYVKSKNYITNPQHPEPVLLS